MGAPIPTSASKPKMSVADFNRVWDVRQRKRAILGYALVAIVVAIGAALTWYGATRDPWVDSTRCYHGVECRLDGRCRCVSAVP